MSEKCAWCGHRFRSSLFDENPILFGKKYCSQKCRQESNPSVENSGRSSFLGGLTASEDPRGLTASEDPRVKIKQLEYDQATDVSIEKINQEYKDEIQYLHTAPIPNDPDSQYQEIVKLLQLLSLQNWRRKPGSFADEEYRNERRIIDAKNEITESRYRRAKAIYKSFRNVSGNSAESKKLQRTLIKFMIIRFFVKTDPFFLLMLALIIFVLIMTIILSLRP